MGAYRLAEIAVNLIESQIRSNIAAALASLRVERSDPIVTTEPPREYFQYETAHVFRPPAVFTIMKGMDPRGSKGPNTINALDDIVVAVVVEDRIQARVVKKAYRYQAALTQVLHQVSLTTSDNALRLFSRVQSWQFSGIVNLKDPKASDAVFRKEVSLRLEVDHIENLE